MIVPGTEHTVQAVRPIEHGMTRGSALLIRLLQEYVRCRHALEPWEDASGASHLEIQKLMYFASRFEPELALDFGPGRYGPYSEQVRHLVQEMDGVFLEVFGGADPVLDLTPITPTAAGAAESAASLTAHPANAVETVANVLRLIEGFESPYGIELLAVTHWVMSQQGAGDPHTAAQAVRQWTRRQGRIYTDDHVRVAFDSLTRSAAGV